MESKLTLYKSSIATLFAVVATLSFGLIPLPVSAEQRFADTNEGTTILTPFTMAGTDAKRQHAMKELDAEKSRVLNGRVADDGAWPWQVALMKEGSQPGYLSQFCGGTLIQDTWVLTAAHCVIDSREDGNYLADKNKILVMVGSNTISSEGDFVPVEKIVAHPNYNPNGNPAKGSPGSNSGKLLTRIFHLMKGYIVDQRQGGHIQTGVNQ